MWMNVKYVVLPIKNFKAAGLLPLSLIVAGFAPAALSATEKPALADTAGIAVLEQQFAGAYPENAAPPQKIRAFKLVASPSQWGIAIPYRTEVWAYNEQIPGPTFRIKLGETIRINFTNKLPQPTTIHWHGIRVPNAMDGVPGITQQPIASGDSYIYQFTPKDAGTFWFHPHVNSAEQIERGLHGVLVVEEADEPAYSQDLVLVVDDWLLEKDAQIDPRFVTQHDLAHDGRWGNFATVNGRFQPSFPIKAGERIRIRMINVANGRVFAPLLPDLSPLVIAVDGMLTGEPFPLKHFNLAPGNRIDLDLVIPKNAVGRRYVIVNTFSRKITPLAVLEVAQESPVDTPLFSPPRAEHFPDWQEALTAPVLHEFQLDAQRGGPYGIAWTIDDEIWPAVTAQTLHFGKFARLRFNNHSSRLHPMHLHGQFFKVIARDGIEINENFWRDTVLIGPKESVDIALVPLDKGLWATHCHILEHAEAGMMTKIKIK